MKKNLVYKIGSGILAASMILTPLSAYAEPMVIEDSSQEVVEPDVIDDEQAVEEAQSDQKNHELADPQTTAEYLLENAQSNVVKQVPTADSDTSLPETFDLRDQGVVTPVKLQNPWGTCWGFAAIAACETSILSEMGKTYEETGLDLSEHHLTYFSRTYLQDGSSQDGEGVHMYDESKSLSTGGFTFTACSLFSSGIGPVDESLIPYRGINSETEHYYWLNLDYSDQDDWTIPEDYEFVQSYELEASNILPSPAVYDFEEGANQDDVDTREASYVGYDASATDAIKQELMAGRAVSICFSADQYMPSQSGSDVQPLYLNTDDNKWCHYTFDGSPSNHAVTIVGWDDTIKSTDFLDHTDDEYGDGEAHQPEGDGAWIVKNSWGSDYEAFPNSMSWGVTDEDGKATGYFYLSYYDRSLSSPETFEFNVTDEKEDYMINAYDYLQSDNVQGWADSNGLQMANVFTAEEDATITELSCQTDTVNTSVTYQVYMLNDDAVTPDDGTLAATATADYAYSGYHKIKLDNPIAVSKGQKYSVIVTSCFTDGDTVYYEFSSTVAANKEYVDEYNRKLLYSHRGDDTGGVTLEEALEEQLQKYYSVGIVNEGESFVYMNALGQWADFGQVVPCLQESDTFAGADFDNFPIKAYLEYANGSVANEDQVMTEESIAEALDYADPAGPIYWQWLVKVLVILTAIGGVITGIVFFIIHLVTKKRKKQKEQLDRLKLLEAENAELKEKLENPTAQTEPEEASEKPEE